MAANRRALCSRQLELAFKRKFRRTLEERFGKPAEKIGVYPIPILLRDQPGYRIGIHSDVAKKAVTVQFYLPRDESSGISVRYSTRATRAQERSDTTQCRSCRRADMPSRSR